MTDTQDSTLPERLIRIEDRLAIEELLYSIASAIDRYDGILLARLIDPSAQIDMGGSAPIGGATFAAAIRRPDQPRPGRMHVVSNVRIQLDRDSAGSECQITSWQDQIVDGVRVTRVRAGRYVDRLERIDGSWRLFSRTMIDEWSRIDPVNDTAPQGRHLGQPVGNDLLYHVLPGLNR